MKKEFNNLLKSESGELKINDFCYLRHYKKDGLNNDVDILRLEIGILRPSQKSIIIEERDMNSLLKRIDEEMKIAFDETYKKLSSDLKCGYLYA